MEIIRLEEAKEYCDKHNVERNEWVQDTITALESQALSAIQYRNKDNHLVTVDLSYIHSHMQSLNGFDENFHLAMMTYDIEHLSNLQYRQIRKTVGELADDFEIGIA